jgi:hypothetical protein
MRPVSLEVGAGDFAFAAGHRRIAISLLAGTLNSAVAFSIAVASSRASMVPGHTALLANLWMFQVVGFGGSGFFAMPGSGRSQGA